MAGSNLGELFVEITADTKKFDSAVDATGKKVTGFETNTKKVTSSLSKLIGGIGVAVLVAKIAELGKASIDAASDAEETRAKFNTAFAGIENKAAETALYLKESYGLSQTESEKLLGATGDLVKGFGANATQALETSTEIQKLSVDLASYNNLQGGASRASEILTKAYLGERDSLISLGIKISDADVKQRLLEKGQVGLTGQTLLLAKGQATLELAMIQSGDAIGDFNRTQDSYANSLKVAKARTSDLQVELGRALLPTATEGTRIFGELTGKLGEYIKGLNDVAIAEQAREEGELTQTQELDFLKAKISEEKKIIENQKKIVKNTVNLDEGTRAYYKSEITSMKRSVDSKALRIKQIKDEIKAEEERVKKKQEADQVEINNEKLKKTAAEDRITTQNKLLGLAEKIQDAGKTDIELIDEQIAQLKTFTDLDESARLEKIAAIKILQEEKAAIEKETTDNEIAENKKRVEDYNTSISDKETADKEYANESIKNYGSMSAEILTQAEELASGQQELNLETAASMTQALAEQTGSVEVAAVALGLTFVDAISDTFLDDGSETWEKALVIALTLAGGIGVGALTSVILKGIRTGAEETSDLVSKLTAEESEIILDEKKALAERTLALAVSTAERDAGEELEKFLEGLSDKEVAALKSAGIIEETNKERLESELEDLRDQSESALDIKLGLYNLETEAEKDLREFKAKLAEEELAQSISDTEAEITELRASKSIEDQLEADALQLELTNDATLRTLKNNAEIDEQTRIDNITKAKEIAAQAEIDEQDKILTNQLAVDKIKQDSLDAQAEAERVYNNTIGQLNYVTAVADLAAKVATLEADKAAAKAELWYNPTQAKKAIKAYNSAISTVESVVIPPYIPLATGAFINGSSQGTHVIVGEGGNNEEIFGMGSQGVPRRQQLANEVASVVLSQLGNNGTTMNFYSVVTPKPEEMRKFAISYEPFAEEYRNGRS